jgi:hypothetical protein
MQSSQRKIGTCAFFRKRFHAFKALSCFQSAFMLSKRFHAFKALSCFQSAFMLSKRFHAFKALSIS